MVFYMFLLIHFLHSTTLHAVRPIVSLFADSLGASPLIIGILFSIYAFFPMLLAIRVGKWLDRYGSWRFVFLGGSGMVISLILPIMYPNLVTLFFLQIGMGVSQLFVTVALQKTVGSVPRSRDQLIATLTFVGAAGGFAGPLMSGFSYDYFGFEISIGSSAALTLTAVLIGLALGKHAWKIGEGPSEESHQKKDSTWQLLHQVKLRNALVISGLVLYSKDLFVAYFPIYASDLGMTASYIGVILSINAVVAMVVRMFQFQLVQRYGRGNVLFTTLILSGFIFILIPWTTLPLVLAVLAAVLGGGLGLGQPLSLVYALKHSPEGRQGEVLGMRLTFNRASQFSAPILFGGIGGLLGLFPIFWVSGGILILGAYVTRVKKTKECKNK